MPKMLLYFQMNKNPPTKGTSMPKSLPNILHDGAICSKCGKRCSFPHIGDSVNPRVSLLCDLCRETTVIVSK